MKGRSFRVGRKVWLAVGAGLCMVAVVILPTGQAEDKQPFHIKGMYVEGCSCSRPCACQLTGLESGCQGVYGLALASGTYQGTSLAGVKIAYGLGAGKWLRVYLDVPKGNQREAAANFAKAYGKMFGPVEAVKDAKVAIDGKDGKYTLTVDGGKVLKLVTEPVLGGDGKRPLMYSNIHDPLHSTVMQGASVSCTFNDGGHSFELKDSNAYFNGKIDTKGEL